MSQKIISVLSLLILVGLFSCSDSDPVAPEKDKVIVAPPPRSIG